MVVIPPEDAKVVIPTDLNVSLTSKPFKISTAALTSRFDAKVETPATVRPSPIFTFFPIPIPPLTIRAPFAVVVEFSVLENVTIPAIFKVDESIESVMKNVSVPISHTRIIPSLVFRVESTSLKFTSLVGGADALDKTRITF